MSAESQAIGDEEDGPPPLTDGGPPKSARSSTSSRASGKSTISSRPVTSAAAEAQVISESLRIVDGLLSEQQRAERESESPSHISEKPIPKSQKFDESPVQEMEPREQSSSKQPMGQSSRESLAKPSSKPMTNSPSKPNGQSSREPPHVESQRSQGATRQPSTGSDQRGGEPMTALEYELCQQGGECAKPIILGEPEKEQLKSVGRHLLKIGRQLLEEMNFVEGMLGKYGQAGFLNRPVGSQGSDPDSGPDPGAEAAQQSEKHNVCESKTCGLQPFAKDNTELVKGQLVEAIAAQNRRLTWLQQATDEYQNAAKHAKFGSAFTTPIHSKPVVCPIEVGPCSENAKRVSDLNNQELKKRLTTVEAKMEDMRVAIQSCASQICEMYTNLQATKDKMAEECAAMREEVCQEVARSEQVKAAIDDKVGNLEAQIIKLAQVVWELKCETRAQMHFGRDYC